MSAVGALVLLAGVIQAGIPVRVGGASQEDGCATLVQVAGTGSRGGVAVRAGPGTRFHTLDRVRATRALWMCEERGGWLGVVYGGETFDCGVATPRPTRAAYAGPCRSGWVQRRQVRLIAG